MLSILLTVLLGAPAPDFTLADKTGAAVALSDFRGNKHVAVLLGGNVPDRAALAARLEKLETALLHVTPANDPEGAIRRKYLGRERATAAVLVDKQGRVRRVQRLESAGELAGIVEGWQLGRSVYTSICERCHGEHGGSELYASAPSLNGIGNRLTLHQIRRKSYSAQLGPDRFLTRSYEINKRELDAVAAYVAGL